MKISYGIILITGFLMYNAYHKNYYLRMLRENTHYLTMIMYGFIGLSLFVFMKKNPTQSSNLLVYANDFIKYLPIDKQSKTYFEPIFNLSKDMNVLQKVRSDINNYREKLTQPSNDSHYDIGSITPQFKRMMNSGKNENTNRSVSQMKKKFVASRQQWRCAGCSNMLDHTYEVDHIQELQYGGTNHVDNLEALCRNCHGKKTVMSQL